jgi:hypothetical protein
MKDIVRNQCFIEALARVDIIDELPAGTSYEDTKAESTV